MKNFFISIALIAVASLLVSLVGTWWAFVPAVFAVSYFITQKPGASFLAGFIALFALWVVYAYMQSTANEGLLAGKMAQLLAPLTQGSTTLLLLITGLTGGLLGAFAALSGNLTKAAFSKN